MRSGREPCSRVLILQWNLNLTKGQGTAKIEVIFHIFYYDWVKKIVRYTEDLVI